MVIIMKEIIKFEMEEIIKEMNTLGILENNKDLDKSEYFNAWNFGQKKGDYEFTIGTMITDFDYLCLSKLKNT